MTPRTADTLVVALYPVGDGPPAEVRFRRALKGLLRSHGLAAKWPSVDSGASPAPIPSTATPAAESPRVGVPVAP